MEMEIEPMLIRGAGKSEAKEKYLLKKWKKFSRMANGTQMDDSLATLFWVKDRWRSY